MYKRKKQSAVSIAVKKEKIKSLKKAISSLKKSLPKKRKTKKSLFSW